MSHEALSLFATVIFAAGGVYYMIKQTKKDVNGLGERMSSHTSKSNTRHQNVTVALMLLADEKQKEKIADLLKESSDDGEG